MENSAKRPLEDEEQSSGPVPKKRQTSDSEDQGRQIFNDPVHGFIELHPLLVKIMHTPQFQRLKDIKQLGVCYWVFPGASHNRFEHSLGTAFLCGKMIDTLQELHRDTYEITDVEVLCVKIAGLCHDLGHGPFSHFFDAVYIPYVRRKAAEKEKETSENKKGSENKKDVPESKKETSENKKESSENKKASENLPAKWTHEEASCALFDAMIEGNSELKRAFESFGLYETQRTFIKELIHGKDPGRKNEVVTRICSKSNYEKWFLYEIVSNKRNGIDCDKFDYFARDCFNVGVKSNFDFWRYFQNIRIIPVDKQLQVCVRDKEVFNLYELFHTRWSLHHRVYQHKTHAAIEHLLTKALFKVDKKLHISSAIDDMERFTRLTDSIIYDILRNESKDNDMREAQEFLRRIQHRELYKFCGQTQQLPKKKSKEMTAANEEREQPSRTQSLLGPCPRKEDIAQEMANLSKGALDASEVFVHVVNVHFGMKDKDPVDAVVFYNKAYKPMKVRREQVSQLLPSTFHERYIRVYAKSRVPEQIATVRTWFEEWCKQNDYPVPYMLEGDPSGYFTPLKESTETPTGEKQPRNLQGAFDKVES